MQENRDDDIIPRNVPQSESQQWHILKLKIKVGNSKTPCVQATRWNVSNGDNDD